MSNAKKLELYPKNEGKKLKGFDLGLEIRNFSVGGQSIGGASTS